MMKLSVMLPSGVDGPGSELFGAAEIAEIGRAAEANGFDAVHVTDHPFPPAGWLATGGHHALDPFVALMTVAATTSTLRLHTHLVVASYRNPFILAKAATTLDFLSAGRLILGIGVGYLEGEFDALGGSFADRNAACDRAITALRAAWTGDPVELAGPGFRATDNVMLPLPPHAGGPPIWAGGNSAMARRRAIALADGWCPFPARSRGAAITGTSEMADAEDLRRAVDDLHRSMEEQGRERPLDIIFAPLGARTYSHFDQPDRIISGAAEMAAAGATYLTIGFPCPSLAGLLETIEMYGAEIIPAIGELSPAAA